MKKTITLTILLSVLVIASIAIVSAVPACNANKGAIWTTNNDCGDKKQNENHYIAGDLVYINGNDFECLGTYNWSIAETGGSKPVIASGTHAVNSDGTICFPAYTIQVNDTGEYGVDFNGKNDNYHVDKITTNNIPEFGTTVGILTALGAVGIFFFVRRK